MQQVEKTASEPCVAAILKEGSRSHKEDMEAWRKVASPKRRDRRKKNPVVIIISKLDSPRKGTLCWSSKNPEIESLRARKPKPTEGLAGVDLYSLQGHR